MSENDRHGPGHHPVESAEAVLYRGLAIADGTTPALRRDAAILVRAGRIEWVADDSVLPERPGSAAVVDASGAVAVPGLVDAHSHLTLPGGAHWIERGTDDPTVLLEVAEHNGRALSRAGVRWARDVGAPLGRDPVDGRVRALSLGVRDRWRDRPGFPIVRAAGTWLTRRGTIPGGYAAEVDDGDGLLRAALGQLDDGADLVKLYLDGPDRDVAPFGPSEVAAVVTAAHARGAKVTAHATTLPGARAAIAGGVDAIEHGDELDADLVREMAARGVTLVSTLAVLASWATFATTTTLPRFATAEGRARIAARREKVEASLRLAVAAGVPLAAGSDFGGGSLRAGHLAWEVECLVDAGVRPHEALAAATWRGGELLGEPDAGRLRPGGPADFFLVHGDPLTEPAALWRVWRTSWPTP